MTSPYESTTKVSPCHPEPQTYGMVSIELPDGRKSATEADVEEGYITLERQDRSGLLFADKCLAPGTLLLNGQCRPCPQGDLQRLPTVFSNACEHSSSESTTFGARDRRCLCARCRVSRRGKGLAKGWALQHGRIQWLGATVQFPS